MRNNDSRWGTSVARGLNRDKLTQTRLSGCKNQFKKLMITWITVEHEKYRTYTTRHPMVAV